MKKLFPPLAILLACSLPVLGQEDWDIRGTSTARFADYKSSGDASASPYPHTGGMFFNEVNMQISRQDSDHSSWRSEISGVYNRNNDYRTDEFGFTPERVNLTRENGTAAIPFRVEMGDFFGYYSFMSLQRSLKGVQVELQPMGTEQRQHSVVFTSGSNQARWRDFSSHEDYFNAVSWMMHDAGLGSWSLNYVHNSREDGSPLDRSQSILSLSGNLPLNFASQQLTLAAEAASFDGDHDGLAGPASGQDRSDEGYRLEVTGRSADSPLDYRLRFDQYGQDFRPRGASITADRRMSEGRSGWTFDNGIRLQARAQKAEDGFETNNAFRTRMLGLNLSGIRLDSWYEGLAARLDAFTLNNNSESNHISYRSRTLTANINAPLTESVQGRLDIFLQDLDGQTALTQDTETRQLGLALDFPLELGGWQGFASTGLSLRQHLLDIGDRDEVAPELSFQLARRYHSIRFSYGGMYQQRDFDVAALDVDTHNFGVNYRYQRGPHAIGLESTSFQRDPSTGRNTEAWMLSAWWTYSFDGRLSRRGPATAAATPASIGAGSFNIDLNALAPGVRASVVETHLENAGGTEASVQGGWLVYDLRVLPEVFQRQRLSVEYVGGVVRRSVVIINFDQVGDARSIQQEHDAIQQQLIEAYGRPARTFAEGDFDDSLVAALNSDRFVRITEWDTETGVLRFGIPRRLDGELRMELLHAPALPPGGQTMWSVEEVR